MARTSNTGYIRQYGSTKAATPAVMMAAVQFTFDPTQAAGTPTGAFVPKGAIPISSQSYGGATGGASPTVDIGMGANHSGLGNDLAADAASPFAGAQNLTGIELAIDTEIVAGVGNSAATGGTVTASVYYIMADDGKA